MFCHGERRDPPPSRAIVPKGSVTRLLSFCPGGACVRRSLFTVFGGVGRRGRSAKLPWGMRLSFAPEGLDGCA